MSHPVGMYVVSVTELWERFSFYIFSGILVLFMMEVLHFSMEFSTSLFGIIIGGTYFFQLISGFTIDKYLGNRKAVIFGGIFMFIAQLIFMYGASLFYLTTNVPVHSAFLFSYPEIIFLIGVIVMIIGASFFKVSITSFVGLFYPDNEELVDSAYTIFYTLINVGGFLAPLALHMVVGVNDPSLYQYGFLVGAITILVSLIIFVVFRSKLCLPDGEPVGVKPISKTKKMIEKRKNQVNEKLSEIEIDRLKVIIFILFIIMAFFIAHEQISISFLIFAMSYVNNVVPFINITLSPQAYLTLNPLLIILISPIFIKLSSVLSKRNKEPSSISKLGIGLYVVGFAFLTLVIAFLTADADMKIGMYWMVIFNLFLVIGELLIMPIALSLVSKLAPPRYTSLMIGVLFASTGIAEIIAGFFASAIPDTVGETTFLLGIIPITGIDSFMWVFVIICVVFGTVWFLFKNKIKKLMHGIS